MDNNLESLLEKYGATDDEQLSRALDEILSDPDSLTAQELEEATDLKLSLMGKNPEDAKDYAAGINEKALESVKALEKKKKTLSVFSKRFMPFAAMLILVVLISFAAKLLPMQITPKPDPSLEAPTSSNNLTDPPPASSESPTSTAAPVTSTVPPTSTAAPVTSTVPPISTVPPATNNGEEAWGSGPTAANSPYDMDFSAVAEYMWDELEAFDPEKYRAWRAEFDNWGDYSKSSDKRDFRDCNLYTFFKDFNITKQQALDEMEEFRQKYTAYLIKNEKVEVVFSDMSEEEIYLYFASPSSVTVGKYAYPADYFINNNYENYKLHSISIEAIDKKLSLLVGVSPSFHGESIAKIITNLAEYKESEGVLEYSATPFEGKEHVTAAYLCEIGSEKWADEGITKEMIEDNLFDLLYTCETPNQMWQIVDGADLWCHW